MRSTVAGELPRNAPGPDRRPRSQPPPFLLLLLACAAAAAFAGPLPSAARAEIEGLMSRLEASGCEFSRNGSWHTAAEAKAHLMRKFGYLEDRGAVQNAEQFIERAATASSMSGQPYLVRCANGATTPSAAWLGAELRAMRSSARAQGPR
jgi:hypothetical protein